MNGKPLADRFLPLADRFLPLADRLLYTSRLYTIETGILSKVLIPYSVRTYDDSNQKNKFEQISRKNDVNNSIDIQIDSLLNRSGPVSYRLRGHKKLKTKDKTMNIPRGFINGLKWTETIINNPLSAAPLPNDSALEQELCYHETIYKTTFRGETWMGFSKQEVENLIAAKYGLFDCRYSVEYEHEDKLEKMGVEV